MSTKTWVQDVSAGYAEYETQAFSVAAANDYVEFEFNSPITLEEIVVESTGTVSDGYDLSIVYPSTEKQMFIFQNRSGASNYYLSNESGKMWYRIPARGKLRVTCSTYNAGFNLTLLAVGQFQG